MQEVGKDSRVAGSNLFIVEISRSGIFFLFWDGEAQPAIGKPKLFGYVDILVLFKDHILTQYPYICDLLFNILGDVIISQEEDLYREI